MRTTSNQLFLSTLLSVGLCAFSVHAQFTFDHIGTGATGSLTTNGPGSYTLVGGGDDIWSASDNFDFAHYDVSGDFDVRVRVESLEPTARWSKAGLMAREKLAPDGSMVLDPTNRMAFDRVTPGDVPTGNGGNGANDTRFSYRTGLSAPVLGEHEDGTGSPNFPNAWLRLERVGDTVNAYRSTDGINWTLQGSQDTSTWEGGALAADLALGLAVGRHSSSNPTATAEFRDYGNADDPVVLSSPPVDTTTVEHQATTFWVRAAGGMDNDTFQWKKDGTDIPGATNATYSFIPEFSDDSASYSVTVSNTVNMTAAVSGAAMLSVTPDTSAPTLLSAETRGNPNGITLLFSEPMGASALAIGNYALDNGASVTGAAYGADQATVVLTTSDLTDGATYSLTISGVEDQAATPNSINPNPTLVSVTQGQDIPGGFYSDFNSGTAPAGTILVGNAFVDSTGGVGDSGVLKITTATNSQQGTFITPAFNQGDPMSYLDLTADLLLGLGTARPADGMSFSIAPDLGSSALGEEGGGSELRVTFDTWDNAGSDTAPAIEVFWGGTSIAFQSLLGERDQGRDPAGPILTDDMGMQVALTNIDFSPVRILFHDGLLDVDYKGVSVFQDLALPSMTISGSLGIGGRTGGANENAWIDNLNVRTARTLGAVVITSPPADQTVTEGQTATFSVSVDGTPNYQFQWNTNGVPIPGATGPSYTTPPATPAMSGFMLTVTVDNEFSTTTSSGAALTVIPDTTPPALVDAFGNTDFAWVRFSEKVTSASAGDAANFGLSGGINVASATLLDDERTVLLVPSAPLAAASYTVTVSDIHDQAVAGNVISPNPSSMDFNVLICTNGVVRRDTFLNLSGANDLGTLTNNVNYPDNPDQTDFLTEFNSPQSNPDIGNFGVRVRGYLIPSETGLYQFELHSDDSSLILLSSNPDPANATVLVREDACCNLRYSDPIMLVADVPYYIEGLMQEGGGGDYLELRWATPSDPNNFVFVPGANLAYCLGLPFTLQPVSQVLTQNESVTFTAAVNTDGLPAGYQWQRSTDGGATFVDITDATNSTYTISLLGLTDTAQYRLAVSIFGATRTSDAAVLTVNADVAPPVALSASSVDPVRIGICFNEPVDMASATEPMNYVVNGGAVTVNSASLRGVDQVELVLDSATPISGGFTVQVSDVADLVGNVIAPNPTSLNGHLWAQSMDVGVTSGPDQDGSSFSCADGDVDVVAGGADVWGTRDEFRFVYTTLTNNFDVKVRVQRLDPVNDWAKAGLMARETLNPDSATIEAYTTPLDPPGTHTYEAGRRSVAGGDTSDWGTRPDTEIPNAWIRLKRVGNTFTAFHAADGSNWMQMAGPVDQPMAARLYVGLMNTAHRTDATTVAEFRSFGETVLYPDAVITINGPTGGLTTNGLTATLSVSASVSNAPPSDLLYQWQRETAPASGIFTNIDFATGSSYTTPPVTLADNGVRFRVEVSVPGASAISQEGFLAVLNDVFPPALLSATGSATLDEFTLHLSELLDSESVTNPANYSVSGGLSVLSATLGANGRDIVLTTSPQTEGTSYTVTVNGVEDAYGNEIAMDSTTTAKAFVFISAVARFERYNNIPGTSIDSDLLPNPKFPDHPDLVKPVTSIEEPDGNDGDDYGVRISGYLVPPADGNYNFFLASDDNGQFWLSTDDSPANLVLLAYEPVWNGARDYNGTDRRNAAAPENLSTTLFPSGISLMAGQRYYFEALQKEGGGGDNLAVAWQLPGGAAPANGDAPIGGTNLEVYVDPAQSSVTITQPPMDLTVVENTDAAFIVAAVGSSDLGSNLTYQWQVSTDSGATWTDVAGATASSLTVPEVPLSDSGDQYRVIVMVPGASATSAAAILTVTADTAPPTLVSATRGCIDLSAVRVVFSEKIDPMSIASATFSIDQGVTVNGATAGSDELSVWLDTSPIADGQDYVLTVNGVTDLAGNSIASDSTVLLTLTGARIPSGPDNLIVFEAENYDRNYSTSGDDHAWVLTTDRAGFTGTGAMAARPDSGTSRSETNAFDIRTQA